jgi:hypothetical protein
MDDIENFAVYTCSASLNSVSVSFFCVSNEIVDISYLQCDASRQIVGRFTIVG